MSNTEPRVQKSMLFLCISHREKVSECSPAAAFPPPSAYRKHPASSSVRTLDVSSKTRFIFVPPQSVPLKDREEQLSAVLLPDATSPIQTLRFLLMAPS